MRCSFCILFLVAFVNIRASDTLTRAQVYSFAAGDTFDYRNAQYDYDVNGQSPPSYSVSYSRCVIVNIYNSLDTPAIVVVKKWLYPVPIYIDSSILYQPSGFEVILDTVGWGNPFHSWPGDTVIVDSLSQFWGYRTNYVLVHDGYFYDGQTYAEGLGIVKETSDGGTGPGGAFDDTTTLIYYSGHNGILGTPYTSLPTYITSIDSIQQTGIRPNPSNGYFNFFGLMNGDNIEIYNVLGQKIWTMISDSDTYFVDLSVMSKGIYSYKINRHNITTCGKIILK